MSTKFYTDIDMGSAAKVINLPAPVSAGDAAPKSYVDSAIEGLAWKDNVRASTQGNINLAAPGAAIDGVTMSANDRVLVRAQTAQSENGIYIWNGAATPMTRSADASTSDELEQAVVTVDEGTDAGVSFRQSTVNFTLGSGSVVWGTFGTVVPSASETVEGKAEIATQAETDAGTDDLRFVTPLKLATYAGRKLKFAQDIGDGSATQYTVTHNFGTRDVKVELFRNSGNFDSVFADVERISTNAVRITFGVAPSSNAYRVLVLG